MLKSNSSLPPQPWNYRVPHSDISIRFRDLGPSLTEIDTAWCLLDAATVAIMHWGQQGPIGPTVLVTMSGDVDLQLVSSNQITWYQWGTAIRGITDFVKDMKPYTWILVSSMLKDLLLLAALCL